MGHVPYVKEPEGISSETWSWTAGSSTMFRHVPRAGCGMSQYFAGCFYEDKYVTCTYYIYIYTHVYNQL